MTGLLLVSMMMVDPMMGMANVVSGFGSYLHIKDKSKAMIQLSHTSGGSASCTLEANFSMETLLIMEMESKEEWMECGALLKTKSDSMEPP